MSQGRHVRKGTWEPWAAIGVVLVLVVVVLLLKARQQSSRVAEVQGLTVPTATVVGTAAADPSLSATTPLRPTSASTPEEQLDRLLAEGQPVLAFFHSLTCVPCLQMDGIVKEVYPDFQDKVGLVDINVYDKSNQNLLQRANLRVIPTLIFIDRTGAAKGYTGVMPADDLRAQLQALAGGQ
jgi:thiol:disulfide interchange protein